MSCRLKWEGSCGDDVNVDVTEGACYLLQCAVAAFA